MAKDKQTEESEEQPKRKGKIFGDPIAMVE